MSFVKHLNFLIVVFILYMYICGVGANPGNLLVAKGTWWVGNGG